MPIDIFRTVRHLRARVADWRRAGETIGMVPTMGALHAGHLALVSEAKRRTDRVIVTLFVNPKQFAPNEDFGSYPRTEAADLERLAPLEIDALFAPSGEEMYPEGFATAIEIGGPAAQGLETAFRPHFFNGVATVVAKLLIAGLPDQAFFGEKDYQQLLVIQRLAADLGLQTEIVGYPTVREADGLALSSRNAYLSAEERTTAPLLHQVMQQAAERIRAGAGLEAALTRAKQAIEAAGLKLDYLEVRNAETLAPVTDVRHARLRMLVAARLGRTRLIDNIPV